MTREKQDKLWAELPEKKQKEYKERYNSYINSIKTETHASNYEWGIKEGEVRILIDTFGEHNLKPSLTYEDIIREIDKNSYISPINGEVYSSKEQVKKENAIHKLLNVAKFLNKNEDGSDWVPDWENKKEKKYHISIREGKILIGYLYWDDACFVYFRTQDIAQQAVQILGEDVVRTALTTEY